MGLYDCTWLQRLRASAFSFRWASGFRIQVTGFLSWGTRAFARYGTLEEKSYTASDRPV